MESLLVLCLLAGLTVTVAIASTQTIIRDAAGADYAGEVCDIRHSASLTRL